MEIDALSLVQMLNKLEYEDVTLDCYLHDIKLLAAQIGVVKFIFIRRSGNMPTHMVAAFTALHRGFFIWNAFGPEFLFNILVEDINIYTKKGPITLLIQRPRL